MLRAMGTIAVVVETDMGNIELELDEDKAPKSVANFLKYADDNHYDGTLFHRVIPGFMAQGGGYDAKLEKKPVREAVENEADNGLKNVRGSVAMARTSDPHSATAQFFINVKDNGFLDHSGKNSTGWGYAVFGKVTEGMDIVDKIVGVTTGAKGPFAKDAPQENIAIKAVRRK
jgi:cyclophilin family peptidyl-prolyl cis-trans isomerase